MNKCYKAYVAGFFDGEGSIEIRKGHRKNSHMPTYIMVVRIAQTNPSSLEEIMGFWGGSMHRVRINHRFKNRNDAHTLILAANKAARFLEDILPFLKLKRERAMIAIEFQEHMRGSRKAYGQTTHGKTYPSDEVMTIRDGYFLRMKELNHRGVKVQ